MRVFVAGASGAVGAWLVPRLIERGHTVIGSSRTAPRADRLSKLGAEPVVLDLLDAPAVQKAVVESRADAVIHQATALSGTDDLKHFDRSFEKTNLLRTKGTDAIVAAAKAAGVQRIIAQSYTSWPYAREGGAIKSEDDPLDRHPVSAMRSSLEAIVHLERAVVGAGGVALRYGSFYGAPDDPQLDLIRKRQFPIVGNGGGIWSFVHFEDAANATVLALERGATGIYNIVDDDPGKVRDWLPALAAAIGAKPPYHVPRWLAHLLAGESGVLLMTEARGASNAKAKRELGWTLHYPSWRQGFVASYGDTGIRAKSA